MKQVFLAVAFAIISTFAQAEKLSNGDYARISVDVTHHFGQKPYDDNNDLHAMVEYETKDGYAVGAYYNSERHMSTFAVKHFYFDDAKKWDVAVGVVTGYKEAKVLPAVMGQYHVNEHLSLFVFPTMEQNKDNPSRRHLEVVTGIRLIY